MERAISDKGAFAELDKLNRKGFKYFGVKHLRTGSRLDVENHNQFIKNLKAKPIMEFKIRNPDPPMVEELRKFSIVMHIESVYLNLYKLEEIKGKLPKGLSKEKCIILLQ